MNAEFPDELDSKSFPDVDDQFAMRAWLNQAITQNGGVVLGEGIGLGGADIDFQVNGCTYNVFVYRTGVANVTIKQ